MTEPDVASSDATNIALRIERDGDDYVLNGRKWWISGALHPHCRILIVMGKTDPDGAAATSSSRWSSCPLDTPGVTVVRGLPVFGYQDQEGHAEMLFEDVRVPAANLIAGEGDGLPDRPGPPRPRAHPPLHARDRRGRARARADVHARADARDVRPAGGRRAATSRTGSPSRGSRSRWRAC